MLSKISQDVEKIPKKQRDMEILKLGMITELGAVSLYEQLAEINKNFFYKDQRI